MGYNSKTIKNYHPINKHVEQSIEEKGQTADGKGLDVTQHDGNKTIAYNELYLSFHAWLSMDEYLSSVYYDPKRSDGLVEWNVCMPTLKRREDSP